MKVSIGMNLKKGPWGGGNQFGHALTEYLISNGIEVSFDLSEPDLDLIVLAEPRSNLSISAYNDLDILRYIQNVNPRVLVVHRVNECDERKGTKTVNRILRRANLSADYTVFVSNWLKDLHIGQGMRAKDWRVILNGSDTAVFNSRGYVPWDCSSPLRLVTHHWGGHWMKGFDIYSQVDLFLSASKYKSRIDFTYIGNLPKGLHFQNAKYFEPMFGTDLANALRDHHVYITASQNEPGSNHQNEGANCGLPLLYRESGCLPEYCHGFGVPYTESNLEAAIEQMMQEYRSYFRRMQEYPHSSVRMASQYYKLFIELLEYRQSIIAMRRRSNWILWVLRSITDPQMVRQLVTK